MTVKRIMDVVEEEYESREYLDELDCLLAPDNVPPELICGEPGRWSWYFKELVLNQNPVSDYC